jgi:hypothetical protein
MAADWMGEASSKPMRSTAFRISGASPSSPNRFFCTGDYRTFGARMLGRKRVLLNYHLGRHEETRKTVIGAGWPSCSTSRFSIVKTMIEAVVKEPPPFSWQGVFGEIWV